MLDGGCRSVHAELQANPCAASAGGNGAGVRAVKRRTERERDVVKTSVHYSLCKAFGTAFAHLSLPNRESLKARNATKASVIKVFQEPDRTSREISSQILERAAAADPAPRAVMSCARWSFSRSHQQRLELCILLFAL